ncbi:MAG: SDR family oxidoreductase [Myxococcales bacterium]|nr:SDR family oxidoreductase [Myxococcales bacterium]
MTPRTALVTGGSRGIGRATVLALVARGARVAAVGRDARALDDLVAAAPAGAVVPLRADLSHPSGRAGLVDRAAEALGGLDAMVAAAGVIVRAPALEARFDDLRAQMEVNFFAALELMRDAGARMTRTGGGGIVAVASTLAVRPARDTLGYAASKAALVAAVRSLALELGAAQVRVNAVLPGVVETDMTRELLATDRERLLALHPVGRLGTPEDIAQAIVWLLEAPFVTGQAVPIDGGLLAR